MTEHYHYQPLGGRDSFRILQLQPRESLSDPLWATLQIVQIGSGIQYGALSYVWGTEERTEEIEFGDCYPEKLVRSRQKLEERAEEIECGDCYPEKLARSRQKLAVTRRLHRALHNLETRGHRSLWVDAVCINQEDVKEKSSQIRLMPKIYGAAESVLVWLGEPEDWTLTSPARRQPLQLAPELSPPIPDKRILTSLSSPWFSRAWALQEMLLARRVLMFYYLDELEELSWETYWDHSAQSMSQGNLLVRSNEEFLSVPELAIGFYTLVANTKAIPFLVRHHPVPKDVISEFGLKDAAAIEFRNILNFLAKCGVTDPRDRIFALFWLADALGLQLPDPDYSKSAKAVFREAGLAIVGLHKELHRPSPQRLESNSALAIRPAGGRGGSSSLSPRRLTLQATEVENSSSDTDSEVGNISPTVLPLQSFFVDILDYHKHFAHQQVIKQLGPSAETTCGAASFQPSSHLVGASKEEVEQGRPKGQNNAARNLRRKRDEEDNDEDMRRPKKPAKITTSVDPRDRLACPYFQRSPLESSHQSSCRGPGFENLSRLKEHLYRAHRIFPCERCGQIFRERSTLTQHLRASDTCHRTDWRSSFSPSLGFDDAQHEAIRSRTVRNWNQIFKILFPDDDEVTYPPQHYQDTRFVQFFNEFNNFYRLELRRLLPERLRNEELPSPSPGTGLPVVPEHLHAPVTGIAERLHDEIVLSYRGHHFRSPQGSWAAPGGYPTDVTASVPLEQGQTTASLDAALPELDMAFLEYLESTAPEGALDGIGLPPAAAAGNADDSWVVLEGGEFN